MSTDPPPPSSLQPVTPKRLDDVIARCLAKDPDAGWQSAGDLAWELGRVLEYDDTPVRERGAGSKLLWLPWLVAAVAGLGALVFVALWRAALSKPRLLTRTSILAPEGVIDAQYIFAVSPDGRFIVSDPIGLVLLTPGRGAGPTRLGDVGLDPVWSPDDRHILYTQADSHELIYKTVGVDGERSLAVPSEDVFFLSDWSPDGSTIALSMPNRETGGSYSVWLYSIEDEEGAAFLDSVANESNAVFSPDGSLLAYQSDESGRHNIYVRPLAGSRAPTRISADGGLSPEWRQDGRELFYMRPDGAIMAVPVEGPSSYGEARELFRVTPKLYERQDLFDVTADGERFLIMESAGPPPPLTVIQNWTTLLER